MNHASVTAIEIERATEQLRQERETFEQRRLHDRRWFLLRLVMGYASVLLLGGVLALSSWVLLHSTEYSTGVVSAAGAALFVDALGLLVSVWRGVVSPDSSKRLSPVTRAKKMLQSEEAAGSEG